VTAGNEPPQIAHSYRSTSPLTMGPFEVIVGTAICKACVGHAVGGVQALVGW